MSYNGDGGMNESEKTNSPILLKKTHLINELVHLKLIVSRAAYRLHACEDGDLEKYLPFFLASLGHAMCRLANSMQAGKKLFSEQFNDLQRGWIPNEKPIDSDLL